MTSEQVSAPTGAAERLGPHPDPWKKAEVLLLQAIMLKDIAGRSDPGLAQAATASIQDIIDELCPRPPRIKVPHRFPPPPPPPDPFRFAAELAAAAAVAGRSSLRKEILNTAESLFSRAVETSMMEEPSE